MIKILRISSSLRFTFFNFKIIEELIDLNEDTLVPISQFILIPLTFNNISFFNKIGKPDPNPVDLTSKFSLSSQELGLHSTKETILSLSLLYLARYLRSQIQLISLPEILIPIVSLLDTFNENC